MTLLEYFETNFKSIVGAVFCDLKPIADVQSASNNLIDLCNVLSKFQANYRIVFGTLLGIFRDGELISHDNDIDIAILVSDREKLLPCVQEFVSSGFTPVRYLKDTILTLSRNGVNADIYLFCPAGEQQHKCFGYVLTDDDFRSDNRLSFKGIELNSIENPIKFFEMYYGRDWRTPIKGLHANAANSQRPG